MKLTEFEYRKYTDGSSLETAVSFKMNSSDSCVIAAAFHRGGFIPGQFNPNTKQCVIPWGCTTHVKEDFYILHLLSGTFSWSADENGNVPPGAVRGPYSETREPMYIGKFEVGDKWVCGKIHPSHQVCYVPDGGKELNNKTYLVLCAENYDPEGNPAIPEESISEHNFTDDSDPW